jgi:hypothetical protein
MASRVRGSNAGPRRLTKISWYPTRVVGLSDVIARPAMYERTASAHVQGFSAEAVEEAAGVAAGLATMSPFWASSSERA